MNQPVRHSNSWTARFKNGKDMQFVFQASVFQGVNWKDMYQAIQAVTFLGW